jgi:hypothetical protein
MVTGVYRHTINLEKRVPCWSFCPNLSTYIYLILTSTVTVGECAPKRIKVAITHVDEGLEDGLSHVPLIVDVLERLDRVVMVAIDHVSQVDDYEPFSFSNLINVPPKIFPTSPESFLILIGAERLPTVQQELGKAQGRIRSNMGV